MSYQRAIENRDPVEACQTWLHAARKHCTPALPPLSVARILTRRVGFRVTRAMVLDALADYVNDDGDIEPLLIRNKSAL